MNRSDVPYIYDGGAPIINPERLWVGPDQFPSPPYRRIDVDDYVHPTFFGRRNAVYQTSIGCPYSCNFCGVIAAYGSRQKIQPPARTAEHLRYLVENHGVDAVHFYDNNFILNEEITREFCERIMPLGLTWWCEARVDAMLRLSDKTWSLLKRSIVGSFHKISVKHLDAYLDELEWRFNNRDNPHIFRDTLARMLACGSLEYAELTA